MPLHRERPRLRGLVVLEGVVVFGEAEAFCVAVRRPSGEIIVRRRAPGPSSLRILRLWGLRELAQSLREAGRYVSALGFSALQAGYDSYLPRAIKGTGELPASTPLEARDRKLSVVFQLVALLAAVSLGLALVLLGPALVCNAVFASAVAKSGTPLFAGESILGAFLVPTLFGALGHSRPFRRWLGYHGALHRAFSAAESGAPVGLTELRRCDFASGPCGLHTLMVAMLLLPYVGYGLSSFSPVLRPYLFAQVHSALGLLAAASLRSLALFLALGLARELTKSLRYRGICTPFSKHIVLPTVQEPSDDVQEVVLAAIEGLGGKEEAQPETRAQKIAWPPLAADACTRGARHVSRGSQR